MKYILFFVLFFSSIPLFAQFNPSPANPCAGSTVSLTNPNPSGTSAYNWDFCTGDLLQTPTAIMVSNNIPNTLRPEGIAVAQNQSDGKWYGFITNRSGNNIVRVDFGDNLNNPPSFTDLGTFGGVLGAPIGIDIIQEGNNYYGVVACISPSKLMILNFLSNLSNTPLVISPSGLTDSKIVTPVLIDAVRDGSQVVVAIANSNNSITIADFGNSITNTPTYTQTVPSPAFLRSISLIKDYSNNRWYGLTVNDDGSTNGVFQYLDFSSGLNQVPVTTNISSNFGAVKNPRQVKILKDGKNFIAYIITNTPPSSGGNGGNLVSLNFGTTMNNLSPIMTNYGNFGMLGQIANGGPPSLSFDLVKQNSEWVSFVVNRVQTAPPVNGYYNELVRINFPNNCNASLATSTDTNPQLSFYSAGTYDIELSISENTNYSQSNYYLQSIPVQSATVGSFTISNQCLGESTVFNNTSVGDDANVSSWQWDFGNGNTSNLKNPTYQYPSGGTFTAKLTVNNTSGCSNTTSKTFVISSRPTASFSVRGGCANATTYFDNASTWQTHTPATGATTFYWDFGDGTGNIISSNATQSKTYTTAGSYTVVLTIVDDVGCSSTMTKTVKIGNVQPTANFSNPIVCANIPLKFTDLSTISGTGESISEWNWKFGALGTSTEQNPSFVFSSAGNYTITLQVRSLNGCQSSTISRNISVFPSSSLSSSFTLSDSTGIPPLKIDFKNSNANAAGYFWDFGDGNTSTLANPSNTYTKDGDYIVKYQALNAQGCGNVVAKSIKVLLVTGLNNPGSSQNDFSILNIYPNPVEDLVMVKFFIPQNNRSPIQLRIFDLHGGLALQKYFDNTIQGENEITADLSSLKSGEYLLILDNGLESIAKKIVVY